MKRVLLGISFGLVWVAPGAAVAAPPANSLFFDGSDISAANGQLISSGHIETNKTECLSGRKIDVSYSYLGSSDFGRVDRAISSANGAFAGTGPATDISSNPLDGVLFKLKKKTYGRHHSKVCPAAAIAFVT